MFCATPAEVAQNSECAFLCVGDTAMSREVILGDKGLVKGAKKGFVIADCSTVSPIESSRMAEELEALGIEFLDAPCTGSKAGAEGGTLTFMIGGKKDVFDHTKPFFEAMGKVLYYCGKSGMGLRAKLTQNLILGNLLQAFNEGLVLSTKAGVDPELMLDILNNSAARSGLISAKAPMVFKRDFSTNFSVKWLEKDIGLALDLGVGNRRSAAADRPDAAALSNRHGQRIRRRRHLRLHPRARRDCRNRSQSLKHWRKTLSAHLGCFQNRHPESL